MIGKPSYRVAIPMDHKVERVPGNGGVLRATVGKVRIAICDDHPVFRAGVKGVLDAESDLEVVVDAGTIIELERSLAENPVDLILLDVELPGKGGLDALSALVTQAAVLMLSAHDDPRRVREALQKGALGFVRKDAPPSKLLRAVRDAAGGKTVMSADLAMRLAESLRSEPGEREFKQKVNALTQRQREVLACIAEGRSNKEIADKLFLSEGTVKNHVTQILQAVGVTDRTKLAVLIVRYGVNVE